MASAGPPSPLLAPPEPPPPKTSRIRGLRGKSVSSRFNLFRDADCEESPAPRVRSKSVAGIRNSSASLSLPPPSPDVPPIPNFVLSAKPRNDSSPSLLERRAFDDLKPPPSPSAQSFISVTSSVLSRTEREIDDLAAQLDLEVEEAKIHKAEQIRRKEEEEAARYAEEVERLEAETDRILAEQRKLDLARLQAQLSTPPPRTKRAILDKLTLFSRSKKTSTTPYQPPGTPSTIAPTIFTPTLSRCSSSEGSPPPERMSFIEPGPKSDAPLSAINGGERRVTVRCLSSTIHLEITTDTTPIDILRLTASMTSHDIEFDTCVVIECYIVLGLERRIRRYEHIRDVMNSWDRDQENSLLIMSCDPTENNQDLEISSVQRTDDPMSGFTVQLYHSARPGKWSKRFVTLLSTGQMFASKRADSQVSDKDSTSLCHLSDFDIYKPKESEARRHLKAPKRFCYAIKSQQKTVVFPNGENFVHFFCTDDDGLAERFFEMVHAWRSWYLVNRQVNLRTREKPPRLNFELEASPKSVVPIKENLKVPGKGLAISAGSFMDESDFTKAIEESTRKLALEAQRNKGAASRRKASVASVAPTVKSEREFAPDGLLGNAYDKRKEEVEAATDANATKDEKADGPFTEGPSLLNSIGVSTPEVPEQPEPEPKSWFPSAAEHSARVRTEPVHVQRPVTADSGAQPGRKGPPPPLLNFNNFPEPPRSRDGQRPGSRPGSKQGHGLRPPPGSPLINYATGGSAGARLGPPPGHVPPPPPSNRGRSRSTAGPSSRRFPPADDLPPVPPMSPVTPMSPMSPRSPRTPGPPGPRPNQRMPPPPHHASPRPRDPRHQERPRDRSHERPQERRQEPLVNHAR